MTLFERLNQPPAPLHHHTSPRASAKIVPNATILSLPDIAAVTKFLRQHGYRNLVGKLNGTFTMAYAQWVSYSILADNFNATIKNASLSWGKFYKYDDKDNELSPAQVNGQVIESGTEGSNVVSSCGSEDSSSGTQGQFDLYDGDTKVVTLVWDCPWGSKTNSWSQTGQNKNYIVSVSGGSSYGGAIGVLTAECFKKAQQGF